eukprot:9884302-Alexandrium_andersonii.AAC.1
MRRKWTGSQVVGQLTEQIWARYTEDEGQGIMQRDRQGRCRVKGPTALLLRRLSSSDVQRMRT